jgi:hypothetical protein
VDNTTQYIVIPKQEDTTAKKGTKEGNVYLYRIKDRRDKSVTRVDSIAYRDTDGTRIVLIDSNNISTNTTIVNKADKCFAIAMSIAL